MGGAKASSATLLERASELALLQDAIAATAAGASRAILIEGPAGIGKTALLRAARQGAGRAGLRVLAARGGELEQELSLGIERQLFEPLLVRASQAERAELLARPATAVGRLFGLDGTDSDPPADEYESHNALYWLCARLAGHSPIMLAIDGVHWSDATSLRFLGYLARRLDDLPVLLALARRVDEPGADEDLAGIAAEPLVQVIRPGPLSLDAVRELAGGRFETDPQDGFVRACHQATGGIPLFTLQLLDEARIRCLKPVDIHAEVVGELAPERVSALALNRLRRLSPAAVKVAEQVALLGTQAEVRHVCVLAALGEDEALTAGDELAAAGLLRSGRPGQPLEFSHPVLRASVYESIAAGRRAGSHSRAARLLRSEKAASARIAMHLLNAPAAGDRWAVEILRAAATAEVRPESRAVYLRRALAEPNPNDLRAALLGELGRAESLTYDARAIEHLSEALGLSKDPRERAAAAAQLASSLVEHDRAEDAEPILRRAIAELSSPPPAPGTSETSLLLRLNAGLLHAELVAGEVRRERLDRAIEMAGGGQSPAELDLLAMAAYVSSAAGSTASEVGALAERVLRDGHALSLEDHMPALGAIWALELADRLDHADRWLLRLMEEAQRRQSPSQFMLAASARADVSCRRGALADAEQDAATALELAQSHGRDYSVYVSAAAQLMALTEQGRLAEAEVAAAEARDSRGAKCDLAIYVCCRGWLRIAQGRPVEALAEFQRAGSFAREAGHDLPGFWAWRIGAATAQLALGRKAEAQNMATEQLRLVQPFGAPGPIGIAFRTLGLIEHGQAQLDLLRAATRELERSPALLERARAQLELGAALRRAGQRTESRQPLRTALDLADRCGAVPVAQRAREELLAAGGRPRRARISSVEALTASELRVARRAASGHTNREIAEELFVTVKVVEKHLASAYRKLGIQGRGELAGLLSQTAGH
jgi:DNA-binding CsgD family transcriptional regulator